jgi:regulator of nucleoside diphosphate kinase
MSPNHSIIIPEADWVRLNRLIADKHLKSELDNAEVVDAANVPPAVVTMDSCVRFEDETTGETREVTIVFPEKANLSEGKVSVLAPVGSALLGLTVGQCIQWPFPDGSRRKLRVVELLYQPEATIAQD